MMAEPILIAVVILHHRLGNEVKGLGVLSVRPAPHLVPEWRVRHRPKTAAGD